LFEFGEGVITYLLRRINTFEYVCHGYGESASPGYHKNGIQPGRRPPYIAAVPSGLAATTT
jgi:hypothetical protein